MNEVVNPPRRARKRSGGVTLHDVAKLAGVAPITASRALNTPEQVSADVRERVRDAIARTGYVPNRLAGGLASTRSRLVAVVVPTISGPIFLETIQALTVSLEERGYQVILGQSGYADSREDALLDAIIGRRPDGIVLAGIMHSPAGRKKLIAAGIPIVETWDLTSTPLDMLVGFSHDEVGRAVVDYLVSKARHHLGVIAADDERATRRRQSFQKATLEVGLREAVAMTMPAPSTVHFGRKAFGALLEASPDIDAVFCASDMLALGVLIEAQIRGIAIPRQLSVVGFGDLEFAADLQPALTTIRIDGTSIGRQAAKFILDRAAGRQIDKRIVDIGFSIVERSSA
jgi:LacI family gluconate utilization system Gnt-I transcriptional repressor